MNNVKLSNQGHNDAAKPEEIRAHLQKIIKSRTLGRSERLGRFLRFVVDAALDGRAECLKEYTVGVEVFGRGADFDPRIDSAVRVDARRLRAKLDEYYAGEGSDDPVMIELPKGGYVPVFNRRRSTPSRPKVHAMAVFGLAASVVLAVLLFARSSSAVSSGDGEQTRVTVAHAAHLMQRRTEDSAQKAIEYVRRVLETDPQYADAHAVMADAYFVLADLRSGPEAARFVSQSRESAQRALELAPGLARPLATMAAIELDYAWDWKRAEKLARQAVEANTRDVSAHARYARMLSLQARHEEAMQAAKRAASLDPFSVTAAATVGQAAYYARRYHEAITHLRRAVEIDGGYDTGRVTLARTYSLLGRHTEAFEETERMSVRMQRSAEYAVLRAWLFARSERGQDASQLLREGEGATSISRAGAFSAAGRGDEALSILARAVEEKDQNVVYMKVSPVLDELRMDDRLEGLCRRVGLTGCASAQ